MILEIIRDKEFSTSLEEITKYIALDSKNRAKNFVLELFIKIENIQHYPFKYRKSLYFDNEFMRDMIFKGYTIVYFIDEINKKIVLLEIFKYKNKLIRR